MARILSAVGWARRSSTLRLSLLLSLVFAIGLAIAVFVALELGRDALERRVDETLEALAGAALLEDAQGDEPEMILRAADDLRGLPNGFRRVAERGGGTVELGRDFLRSDVWRLLITEDIEGDEVLVAVPLEDSEQAQELLAGILWSTGAVVIVLTLAIGLVAGLWAQRRLQRIEATMARLAAGDLAARTGNTASRDDLDDISRQLDDTAGALERLVAQTRHLSASIAHDLRTPLARLHARLEALPEGEARADALEEALRLSGIFDTIMRVARIEAAQGRDGFATVSLSELVEDMAETFAPVVEDAGKVLRLDLSAPVTVQADRQMLVQALANLIQNAIVHGGTEITLFARGHSLGVSDNGPGVPPAQFEEIIKPMVRLDDARSSPGSGLGLALVRAVADRHGAELALSTQEPTGLSITLNLA